MASAPRHGDVCRVNWAPQVKPDVWGPHVSDTGANPGQTQRWLGFDQGWGPLSVSVGGVISLTNSISANPN